MFVLCVNLMKGTPNDVFVFHNFPMEQDIHVTHLMLHSPSLFPLELTFKASSLPPVPSKINIIAIIKLYFPFMVVYAQI